MSEKQRCSSAESSGAGCNLMDGWMNGLQSYHSEFVVSVKRHRGGIVCVGVTNVCK